MDNLKLHELQKELRLRGVPTEGKRKPELVSEFDDLRKGIVNVPALLQGTPEKSLRSLGLEAYEVAPTEPLHDIKGHISNLIEELLKAVILIARTLMDFGTDRNLTQVFQTAAELTQILYSRESKRNQQTVLRLHNVAFVHHQLCSAVFSQPKSMSRRKMFGRYFHSLTCHAPLLYRIICLRSLTL